MDNLGLSDLGLTQSLLPWVVDLIGSHGSPRPSRRLSVQLTSPTPSCSLLRACVLPSSGRIGTGYLAILKQEALGIHHVTLAP